MYLNCKTYYSLLYGCFSTEELVTTAQELGIQSLALTNINTTSDCWDFIKRCREVNIHPVVGAEIRNGNQLMYVLLAASHQGLAWIHRFISKHLLEKKPFPPAEDISEFFNNAVDGHVIFPFETISEREISANEWIGIRASQLNRLVMQKLREKEKKMVILQPVSFQNRTYYNVHRLLRAIDQNCLLSQLPAHAQGNPDECIQSPARLLEMFRGHATIITNSIQLLENCRIEMDYHTDKNLSCFTSSKEDDRILLQKLAGDGLIKRYGKKKGVWNQRLEKELAIINQLGFNAYFLVNWDIVRYAQSRGFYYVGRGSGANSLVAYCLGITEVDPIELNLYFERFLNPHRTSPPDFDIDFSWRDRDEVMDYIFKRYGKAHVALLGSFKTFRQDSIIQELGKVFGYTRDEIKTLQRSLDPQDDIQKLILKYGKLIRGFPHVQSLHPCGMLISDEPVTNYATLFMPPKGFPTAQLDMFVAEDIGLNKFDILSQRGLGHIRESLDLVRRSQGKEIDIHDFARFKKDKAIREKIKNADTIGCFYIESPAMRQLLKKLHCDDYNTLVAASSIIRPGVAQSGMMREYISRYHQPEKTVYLHPLFEEHLSETFGVMVFQEDVIKIAHYFAGLDLGEADILRRAMSGKYRSNNQFMLIRDRFFEGCKLQGHTPELAAEVWRQMESFAGYSFNKAHSASFALESYMSLYLKTYYPKEFMVAVINNFGGFYSRELYFLELLKSGASICAPCVNRSEQLTCIREQEVYTGFIHVKGLQEETINRLVHEREAGGEFLHLQDFIERTSTGLEQLNMLVSIGAFRFTGKTKKQLLWEANFLQKHHQEDTGIPMFREEPLTFQLPEFHDDPVEDLYDQMELMGFTLTNPFELVQYPPGNHIAANDLPLFVGKKVQVLAYYIAHKHVITKNNDAMFFGTFVDEKLDWIDTVHFPDSLKKYPLQTGGFYKITGKVVEDFGVCSLEVHRMERVAYKPRKYAAA